MFGLTLAAAVAAALVCRVEVPMGTSTLEIDDAGRVASLRMATGGRELAVPDTPFCQITTDAGVLTPASAAKTGDRVTFGFPGDVKLTYRVTTGAGFSIWEMIDLEGVDVGKVKSILLCNLHLTGLKALGGGANFYYDDGAATAVMATHVNVLGHVNGPDAKGPFLVAESYQSHGVKPAGFGILACPREVFEATIDAFENAAGLPNPHPGGVWSKISPWVKRSYLFITSYGEKDTDELIKWARRGNFDMILIGENWSKSHGHHEVNRAFFPDGLPSLVRSVGRLKKAGFHVGLHLLGAGVYSNDPYVTPVPDPRLFKDAFAELGADVDEKATDIPTTAAPAGFPADDGGYMGKGVYFQIGDEIVTYNTIRGEAPFGFGGCARGALGTKAAPHHKGDRIAHIMRSYGYFLHDLDTTLSEEVVTNVCKVANAISTDMMYFDGSEGLQGDHWYYNGKLQSLYYEHLKNKNVLLQGSSWSHYSWHLISRTASADGSGDVKHYLDERAPAFAWYASEMMPLDIGWYYVYDPAVTADQFEYILQKCVGFDSSISVQTNPDNLRTHPEMGAIMDLVRTYEDLRLSKKVPEATRKLLREPGREYRLLERPARLRRTAYGPWKQVAALDGKQNVWNVEPVMPGTRLGMQVTCGPQAGPGSSYRSAQAVTLETFDDLAPYLQDPNNKYDVLVIGPGKAVNVSSGVTQEFASVTDNPIEGKRCGRYTATSTLADGGGWSAIGKHFSPVLDLSFHKALGFWLRGDGGGGAFKLQLDDDKGGATDYYITNDFTEWRYFQLLRPTVPQPYAIDYSRIAYLIFYYNGLPAKKTVTVWIDDVKALADVDHPVLTNPELRVGDKRIVVPATLTEGERLVYFPGQAPYVIPPKQSIARRTLPAVPDLPLAGAGPVTFSAAEPFLASAKVRIVQDCPEELRLP
jgi:hypothetical protein